MNKVLNIFDRDRIDILLKEYDICQKESDGSARNFWTLFGFFISISTAVIGAAIAFGVNTYCVNQIHPIWIGLVLALIAGPTINAIAGFGEELGWRGFLQKEFSYMGFWKSSAVIGVIYLLFIVLKRGARKKMPENEMIRNVDHRGLSGNRKLQLVMVGSSIYLVGSSENGVNLISEITDKETIDTIKLELAQVPERNRTAFSDFLSNVFKPPSKVSIGDSLNFMKKQKDRIKNLR